MLFRQYQEGSHVFRLVVFRSDRGWELHEERDQRVIKMTRHSDWHRVERAIQLFERRQSTQP
jgi:hypothetical protein